MTHPPQQPERVSMNAVILPFPISKSAIKRFAQIKCDKYNADLDVEIAKIKAKVDKEIYDNYGSMEAYGRFIINNNLPWARFDNTWSV